MFNRSFGLICFRSNGIFKHVLVDKHFILSPEVAVQRYSREHSFSTFAKYSGKITLRVRIRGLDMLVFRELL